MLMGWLANGVFPGTKCLVNYGFWGLEPGEPSQTKRRAPVRGPISTSSLNLKTNDALLPFSLLACALQLSSSLLACALQQLSSLLACALQRLSFLLPSLSTSLLKE